MPLVPIVGQLKPPKSGIPPHIWDRIDERVRKEQLQDQARIATYGDIRSIIHLPDYAGYRLVVVRSRVYYSKKWKFFTDFLFEYGLTRFEKDWFDQQNSLSLADQHPLFVWKGSGAAISFRARRMNFSSKRPAYALASR
jgi:hypothetical protein